MALTKGKLPPDLFVAHGKEIEAVLQKAVHRALLVHKHAGNPIAILKDGKVTLIAPEDIPDFPDVAGNLAL